MSASASGRIFNRGCIFIALLVVFSACKHSQAPTAAPVNTLFKLLPAASTNIYFNNKLTEQLDNNILLYEYFYNGGGVAVGDLNGDGKQDIYFSGNMTDNKLYLNKGQMKFEDITTAAGVAGRPGSWKTGVSIADVNGDGKLDIYVCYSGRFSGEKRKNQLFINQGNNAKGVPVFKEEAEQYGLADSAYSTQAIFFDYDHDGDLDMLLLNHNPDVPDILDESGFKQLLSMPEPRTGVRLFRNDKGHFTDITTSAKLSSTTLSYGLSAGVADLNGDGWPDIYISNDYNVPDFLYINNHDGTFTDELKDKLGHTSLYSMGNDVSDINNDAQPDIVSLDMLPAENKRQKLLLAPDNYESFNMFVKLGFNHQYMRNMLQLNNGNGTFSEIGQLAGISNTDWSWSPLVADFDNDGWKDMFISNGYTRDYTNMDFLKFIGDHLMNRKIERQALLELVKNMPTSAVKSYFFKNNGDLTFTDTSIPWGITLPANSNGAAYADLNNDGDLDVIVNNVNSPAFIYQNQSHKIIHNHYLELKLQGAGMNTQGIGATVTIYAKDKKQFLEQMPTRGYESTVSSILHFGLGKDKQVDSLRVVWELGKEQVLTNIKADQLLTLNEKDAHASSKLFKAPPPIFNEVKSPIAFVDTDYKVNDFKRQPLMANPQSFQGPCMVKGDVNGDGLPDIYIGGNGGKAGVLYIQQKNGSFIAKAEPAFVADRNSFDTDALFFDANGDGKPDLYVCSGGYYNFMPDDPALQDRLYLNDGKGNFTKAVGALPKMTSSKSCVRVADINGDGYPDLFVGGKVTPGRYPETPLSYILINDGKGHFTDETQQIAPDVQSIGMVTDAAWVDMNGDKKPDLVLVGEWMPVTIMINHGGKLLNKTKDYFDKPYSGWWNKLLVADLNGDGKPDLVIGNLGTNTQCRVSDTEPAEMYYKDFDDNGSVDPMLCFYIQHKSYPYVTRDELLDQISAMRTRFPDYKSYADAAITDVFTTDELQGANHLTANYLKTAYFASDAKGRLHEKALPLQAQFSPVFTITPLDFDHDGKQDLLLCGNINQARLRFGKYDANYGILLKGDGKGNFTYVPQLQSGFKLWGDVRSVLEINNTLLFGVNQQPLKAYKQHTK